MPQARGTQLVVGLFDESTYATEPGGTPAGAMLRVKTFPLSRTQARIDSETLPGSNVRERTEPVLGNVDVSGGPTLELNAESMSRVLKHAIAAPITGRPIGNQPTNITGVVAEYTETTTDTGNGTLAYDSGNTTLAWTANGDSAGTPVDVSAGGAFTLESSSADKAVTVTVAAGDLPGGNQTDTDITVIAAYEHRYSPGALPVGMHLERDYGANIAGTGRYERFAGVRVASTTFRLVQEGFPEVALDLRGATSTLASAPLDASLTDDGHTGFSAFQVATVEEGGAAIALITEATITLDNDLDDSAYVLGSGVRAAMAEGFATVSGQITALFESPALLAKAIADTESSLRFVFRRGTGVGTAGNEQVEFLVNQLKYEPASPPVEGPRGVLITLPFRAYRSGTTPGLEVRIRNQIAAP